MITVITGTPGAGKTLYTIEKLLLPLVGTTVKGRADDGSEVEYPRTIYTNINGLLIDHELIDGGDSQGLQNWHEWAKPGSVIVFDEVQKVWPPRANGSKIPPHVQELDTHRHKGVDFIIITQSVMNIDRHVHALGGRHLHVRRVGNMKAAIVYEWDHVSRSLMYSKSIGKTPWRYSKKVFELYKSSELHTKQPRSVPTLVWFVLVGLIGLTVGSPFYYQRMKSRFSPEAQVVQVQESASGQVKVTEHVQAVAAHETPDAGPPVQADVKPQLAGCVAGANRCTCFDFDGKVFDADPGVCEVTTSKPAYLLAGGERTWDDYAVRVKPVEHIPFTGVARLPGMDDFARAVRESMGR